MELRKLAGVFLTKDINSDTSQFLGTVSILSIEEKGNALRNILLPIVQSTVSQEDCKTNFVFLTPNGWEVNNRLEHIIAIRDLLCPGDIIKIRLKDVIPRLGIVIVDESSSRNSAVGYIQVPTPTCSINELRQDIEKQQPSLHKRLKDVGNAQFLDCNGWPITHDQEESVLLIRAIVNNVIKIQIGYNQYQTPTCSPLPPVIEIAKMEEFNHEKLRATAMSPISVAPKRHSLPRMSSLKPFDIMISYVHKETAKLATILCDELRRLNYSVFVDVLYIKPGIDWQDVINEAVYNCSVFVPLISNHYGLTDWTNKEVKLADTLEKLIIPINFISTWPPMCLAIQFSTTQFISWGKNTINMEPRIIASKVAAEISERYQVLSKLESEEEITQHEEEIVKTELEELEKTEEKIAVKKNVFGKKFSAVIRKSLMKKDSAASFVVITYHPKQADIIEGIQDHLEGRGYDVWASSAGTEPNKRQLFKTKVNEAGAVLVILSNEFAVSEWCEQEVYYCEGRKRLIPIIIESINMPCWMATLIGTETILDIRSNTFYDNLSEEVDCATQPAKAEGRLRKLVEQKTQIHRMCTELQKSLPNGKLVYISGGTKLFSRNGEAICRDIGKCLAKDRNNVLVTGGFYGVGETVGRSFYEERKNLGWEDGVIHIQAVKDSQDRTVQTRQNPDGTLKPVPYGKTIFIGSSIRQRVTLTAKVIDLSILIEGGPGAAFEAHQFSWNDRTVIPIIVTGGAAAGKFNVPQTIFIKPIHIPETDWLTLQDEQSSPIDIAKAVASIVAITK